MHTRLIGALVEGQAYVQLRRSGEDRLGDVVLSLSSDLLAFDYRETFTGAFEVRSPPLPSPCHHPTCPASWFGFSGS